MFKPRHAYRSSVTNRYRGKAKGCPVFNSVSEITSSMVEQHDECLECLAKMKNRADLYRTLADNDKPNNNVIKSLQRLSSSASNNRLKTCLQFLIIKVNEKSILTPQQNANGTTNQESTSLSPSPSPSPLSSPDIINELKGPRLKLSEDKIRRIKKRPVLLDELATTPTTSEGCSPGQHSTTTQDSDQFRLGLPSNNLVIHMFQAPPRFVNDLKPCNLPPEPPEPVPSTTPPAGTKDMLNCAICGIKDRPTNISKIYGQNSCLLCTKFFASFLKRPRQWYCAQDGDCLMTFDSRCKACWIKICLQKFDIEEEHRKVGLRYSPKLLSSPNVSLITIDTSLSR